jgi:hypothetical protein
VSKYERLTDFLKAQVSNEVVITYAGRSCASELPPSSSGS